MTVRKWSDATGVQVRHLKWLPFPPADISDGNAVTHNLMVIGALDSVITPYEDDPKVCVRDIREVLILADIPTSSTGRQLASHKMATLATFAHAGGRMTCLTTCPHRSSTATLVLSGSQAGLISCIALVTPQSVGSNVDDIQVTQGIDEAEDGFYETSGKRVHSDAVTAVDVCSVTDDVLSSSADGSLHVTPLTTLSSHDDSVGGSGQGALGATVLSRADPWRTINGAKWTMVRVAVTCGSSGGLQIWDTRKGGGAVLSSDKDWGFMAHGCRETGATITCLATHPSRPHVCVTGTSEATLAIWDLRMTHRPVTHKLSPDSHPHITHPDPHNDIYGPISQVHFDRARENSSDMPVIACTESGHIFEADMNEGGDGAQSSAICSVGAACMTMDMDPAHGTRVVVGMDDEQMAFVTRDVVEESWNSMSMKF